ncbi:hypothetical protein [Eoetvoesiella caeni]
MNCPKKTIDPLELLAHITTCSESEESSAQQLLLDLLDAEMSDTENGTLIECARILAARGRSYSAEFGVSVHEHTDKSHELAWGFGDAYTWCALGHVLDACEQGPAWYPDWYESDWVMVLNHNDDWVQKDIKRI